MIVEPLDRRSSGQRQGWFLFIGADDEAITTRNLVSGDVELRKHVTMGDVHAGVAFPLFKGHGSFGVPHRTIEYSDRTFSYSMDDQVAGLSFARTF